MSATASTFEKLSGMLGAYLKSRTAITWYHWMFFTVVACDAIVNNNILTWWVVPATLCWWLGVILVITLHYHATTTSAQRDTDKRNSKDGPLIENSRDYCVLVLPLVLGLLATEFVYIPCASLVAKAENHVNGETVYVRQSHEVYAITIPFLRTITTLNLVQNAEMGCVAPLHDHSRVRAHVAVEFELLTGEALRDNPYFGRSIEFRQTIKASVCRAFAHAVETYSASSMPGTLVIENSSFDAKEIRGLGIRYAGTIKVTDVHAYVASK